MLPAHAAEADGWLIPKVTEAPAFADTAESWCRSDVEIVCEAGLMEGRSSSRFDPQGTLTYGQVVVIAARLQDLLRGGDGELEAPAAGEAWYQPAADQLAASLNADDSDAAAYLLKDLDFLDGFAELSCDRYDFVWYLAAVLPEDILTPINEVSSLPDTSDNDILAFYRAGILSGSDRRGTFNGEETLNRSQAAAILARIVDPARRVRLTLAAPSYAKEVLGLEPDTVMLTVDGYDITADTYLYFLAMNISAMEAEQAYGYYDTYSQYYVEYWADQTFTGDFAEYLLEKHGIDVSGPVDWNVPDRGGMTPAQKVLQDTREDAAELAVLMARQEAYPLTDTQQAQIQRTLDAFGWPYGFSGAFAREFLTAMSLTENLAAHSQPTAAELTELLAGEGYLYGQYAVLYRGGDGFYESDEAAFAAAEEVRQKLSVHLSDPEYLEFLIWKYSEDPDIAPDLLSLDGLSDRSVRTLKALPAGRVSPVLEEEDRYLVVVKLDPTEDLELLGSISATAAQAQLTQWAREAQITVSAACEALDVAAAAAALSLLDI